MGFGSENNCRIHSRGGNCCISLDSVYCLWGPGCQTEEKNRQADVTAAGDDVYVYNKGPCSTGIYKSTRWRRLMGGTLAMGKCGAIGYSSCCRAFHSRD